MTTDFPGNKKIILASRSPRRKELLEVLGIEFEIRTKDFDETFPSGLRGSEIVMYLSSEKARLLMNELHDDEVVIAADTIVWCKEMVLGKPADRNEAIKFLRYISGDTHEVITGVTILSPEKNCTFFESTKVTFEELNDSEIEYYVDNYQPFDKAGAYGIQEWIGIAACSHIDGSYFNVVGLPVHRLYKELKRFVV